MKLATSGSSAQVIDIIPYLEKAKKEKLERIHESMKKNENTEPSLAEIADALVQLTIILDYMGHFKYGNMISDVVGLMFEDPELHE